MANEPNKSPEQKVEKLYMNRNVIHNGQHLKKDSECPANCLVEMKKFGYASKKKEASKPIGSEPQSVGNPGSVAASEPPTAEKAE